MYKSSSWFLFMYSQYEKQPINLYNTFLDGKGMYVCN